MIEFTKAYKTSTGETFATLDEAQRKELSELLALPYGADGPLERILNHKEKVVDILTTTQSSKPRARSIHGGRKKRKTTPDPAAVNRALQDGKQ